MLWISQITISFADRQDHLDEGHDVVDIRLILVQAADSLEDVGKYLQQLTFAGQRVDNGPNTAKRQASGREVGYERRKQYMQLDRCNR